MDFNRYLERTDFMNLCTRLLKSTNLSNSYIKLIQEEKYNLVLYTLNMAESVESILKNKNI